MLIKIDDLTSGDVVRLLQEHMKDMLATSPPESVHALDVGELKASHITFFSGWEQGSLLGCIAIKTLTSQHAEIKSMRTATNARNKGVGSALLEYVIMFAREQGYQTLSLETGSMAFFKPARELYKKYGFEYCQPFADYQLDPNSRFMSRTV
ncbi:GNAT family N-acetyltransferase [Vibrio sp. MA40-2]|uniref:GNAT family N-acetyltransferase n=1 Tax=Vibrio sp. MA40-2 TaxID=3391828 RepID=UPI0039A755B9